MNKDYFVEQYNKLKQINGGKKPLRSEFLKYCKIHKRDLDRVFGQDPYSKLQKECCDEPNKLSLEKVSVEEILEQYGNLTRTLKRIPVTADWLQAGCYPQSDGIRKIHGFRWQDMPRLFIEKNGDNPAWNDINTILAEKDNGSKKQNKGFSEIVDKLNAWVPDRKRLIEEGYKIEIRNYLSKYFSVEEEGGESNADLVVNNKYPVEIKKDPSQSEYDRLLGQMIRHNKIYGSAIAVITGVSSEDRFKKNQRIFVEVHAKLGMEAELILK